MTEPISLFNTSQKINRYSPFVKDEYYLESTPINKDEFHIKINYWSYFKLISVPSHANIEFHTKAAKMDSSGAMGAIKVHVNVANYKLIKQHIDNAIKRVKM